MTLNPITYTENVVGDFLRHQVTEPDEAATVPASQRVLPNLDEGG